MIPVRITAGPPRFRLAYSLGGNLPCLYPDRTMLAIDDTEQFDAAYRTKLEAVGVPQIAAELESISTAHGGTGLVLLCFEDVPTLGEYSCHRRSFARWWEERTGQAVPELTWDTL